MGYVDNLFLKTFQLLLLFNLHFFKNVQMGRCQQLDLLLVKGDVVRVLKT